MKALAPPVLGNFLAIYGFAMGTAGDFAVADGDVLRISSVVLRFRRNRFGL